MASLDDVAGLTSALTGVNGAYLLVPPDLAAADFMGRGRRFLGAMSEALGTARVPHVVFLSSIGAQLAKGTGPVVILHEGEKRLSGLRDTRRGRYVLTHMPPAAQVMRLLGQVLIWWAAYRHRRTGILLGTLVIVGGWSFGLHWKGRR